MKKIILLFSLFVLSCGFIEEKVRSFFGKENRLFNLLYKKYQEQVSGIQLTDEVVKKYICAYKTIRTKTKDQSGYFQIIKKAQTNPTELGNVHKAMEKDVQKCGIKDLAEFTKINAKVAWAWNVYQGTKGKKQFQNLNQWGIRETRKAIQELEKQLQNPKLSESDRRELQKGLETLKKQEETLKSEGEKNQKWADFALNIVKPLTSEEDIKIIKKYESELMQVFTGLSEEQIKQMYQYQFKP